MRDHYTDSPFDLRAGAHRAMIEAGFEPDLPPEAARQLESIERETFRYDPALRDLRGSLWSSIDNQESRDLDQVEFAERATDGDIRVQVGIADVDCRVPAETPIDRHAAVNMTTVYAGVAIFPMLPGALSTDLTSLNQDQDRQAIVIDMLVSPDGAVRRSEVYPALLRNRARLSYEQVGPWLEGRSDIPDSVTRLDGMEAQVRLQHEAAQRLHAQRYQRGALDFETVEAIPVIDHGHVVDLAVPGKNPARYLVEDFMIAANSALAGFMESSGAPSLQRIVRSPERWPRIVEIAARLGEILPQQPDARALSGFLQRRRAADPLHFPDLSLTIVKLLGPGEYAVVQGAERHEGHFGLAVDRYTHSTAPNRRYADLIMQRLVKSCLAESAPIPYSPGALEQIAQRCTERENAASKVERRMRKMAAAAMLHDRIGQIFEGVVTGASPKGVYARLLTPPVEGRIVSGEQGLDVGDRTRLRLIAADPESGYIDFAHLT